MTILIFNENYNKIAILQISIIKIFFIFFIFFQEHNTFKLMFDTPGSQVNREISAVIAFDIINNNVTALFQSAGNSLIAKG